MIERDGIKVDVPWCNSLFPDEYRAEVESIRTPRELTVQKIENVFANEWCLRHHYLKRRLYIAKNVSYGIFKNGFCFGVVVFGYPVWTQYKGIVPPPSPWRGSRVAQAFHGIWIAKKYGKFFLR